MLLFSITLFVTWLFPQGIDRVPSLDHVINGATADDNDVQNFIVDYLKKLLNDFKKKLNKELNKYGNITDVFIS